jgi:hypothetical protein
MKAITVSGHKAWWHLPHKQPPTRLLGLEGWTMTELEEAELRLRRARAQRQWAARQNDYELEQELARESHRCWVEVEGLKARKA